MVTVTQEQMTDLNELAGKWVSRQIGNLSSCGLLYRIQENTHKWERGWMQRGKACLPNYPHLGNFQTAVTFGELRPVERLSSRGGEDPAQTA